METHCALRCIGFVVLLLGCESRSPDPATFAKAGWDAHVEWKVGGVDAQGPGVFGIFPLSMSIGPQGSLYVLDGHLQGIRVFDSQGNFVRSFAPQGQGPGELIEARVMGWDWNDHLWVAHVRRYSVFDSIGGVIQTVPRPFLTGSVWGSNLVFDTEDTFVETLYLDRGREVGTRIVSEAHTGSAGYAMVRIDRTGRIVEELPPVAPPPFDLRNSSSTTVLTFGGQYSGGGREPKNRRLSEVASLVPWPVAFLERSGLWFTSSSGGMLTKRSLQGDTLRAVSIPREPTPLARFEEDLIREVLALAERRRDDFVYGHQPFRGVGVFPDGKVALLVEEQIGTRPNLLDIFAADGTYMGELRLGFTIDPLSSIIFDDDGIVAVALDEFDTKTIVRISLRMSP